MNIQAYKFPHPILGLEDNIEGVNNIQVNFDENTDEKNYLVNLIFDIDNQDILRLISEKKAVYFCEINCSSTLYRSAHSSELNSFSLKIPKDYVRDNVDLLFLITAKENIPEYYNSKSHAEFSGYKFDIEQGDILGYIGESSFFAGIAYNKLKAASSFMEIVRGEKEEGDYNIILDNNKIQIQLSQKDYDRYVDPIIGKNANYKNIIHSSFVLPTLIFALNELLSSENKDDYVQKSWAKIIEFRMNNDTELKVFPLSGRIYAEFLKFY
jgi:hypothetical protein